jgi:hypothetical protein
MDARQKIILGMGFVVGWGDREVVVPLGRTVVADMLGFGIESLADTGSPRIVLCRATLGDVALV